jgi:hypothetical protein
MENCLLDSVLMRNTACLVRFNVLRDKLVIDIIIKCKAVICSFLCVM